jgi:hypothetical protein
VYKVETPDDGQICPKHVEFFIKNKFEKQCMSLGFIIRIIIIIIIIIIKQLRGETICMVHEDSVLTSQQIYRLSTVNIIRKMPFRKIKAHFLRKIYTLGEA